ncbi:beta-1,3-galactosyltransferase 5-like [Watersipora subatra]|uniref:beta-1,3-galactosyltransferase 5-like n=1 Tax=Watersipora subatra TaxID=2589382 RepID=UPI00355B3EFB
MMVQCCYICGVTLAVLHVFSVILPSLKGSLAEEQEVPYDRNAYGSTIVNFHNFSFYIQPRACEARHTLLVAVHSSVRNQKKREIIRNTWGNPKLLNNFLPKDFQIKLIFIVARSVMATHQLLVGYEAEMFSDILQINYIDHYRNNTYKALYNMRWITSEEGCPHVTLVMKADDDVMLNVRYFGSMWKELFNLNSSYNNLLYAGQIRKGKPFRWNRSKWYLPVTAYKFSTFPQWCLGLVYFFTPDLARQVYNLSFTTPYIYTDDVYIGIVADRVDNLIRVDLALHYAEVLNKLAQNVHDWSSSSETFYHCSSHSTMYRLWLEYCFCKHCFSPEDYMMSYLRSLCSSDSIIQ